MCYWQEDTRVTLCSSPCVTAGDLAWMASVTGDVDQDPLVSAEASVMKSYYFFLLWLLSTLWSNAQDSLNEFYFLFLPLTCFFICLIGLGLYQFLPWSLQNGDAPSLHPDPPLPSPTLSSAFYRWLSVGRKSFFSSFLFGPWYTVCQPRYQLTGFSLNLILDHHYFDVQNSPVWASKSPF